MKLLRWIYFSGYGVGCSTDWYHCYPASLTAKRVTGSVSPPYYVVGRATVTLIGRMGAARLPSTPDFSEFLTTIGIEL
ncbi:unnamed protein product [Toxocara canis]|uniref:Secreted protein n=1 Tax=Toxocara canis TaxID=6265 RepID=A0A183TXX3_TOXCA|nr:unnamed protein product [Toxocara canis]